ncbi:ABC transporter permease/substrate-binding protein [Bacillus gobiensis]|uniref:Glycine/betaine ABC transporter permease n=1 Tax=Bacillus gobiensis TaxID=1441095 RepID=A0A0M4FP88_9BACI|nr:ABC transporter permease/substrate-binding protein [Bacillus gobiensis]ALC80823.1 glycine/betaine ABC transporter permease [Bacillus gobiensis]
MNSFIDAFYGRKEQLASALIEHIQISFVSLLLAILISIPLGIFLTRKDKLAEPIIGVTAVLQTIPSLALLGLLIPLAGIGKIPAVIALTIYALLPILRNTYTGIKEVDPSLIEAAKGMGMNSRKRLSKVEIPLAFPVIMAGVRTAMVLIIGTATLAALIGAGGLGDIILLGIDRNDNGLILIGAVPAAVLAILFDLLLRLIERASSKTTIRIAGLSLAAVILIISAPLAFGWGKKDLVIAGKLGSEPEILINMYKLLIEEDTDLKVELQPGLGKTSFLFNALRSGDIDLYPEFTGTTVVSLLNEDPVSTDAKEVFEQAKNGVRDRFNFTYLEPMSYNNTYAVAVTKEAAEQFGMNTISDLTQAERQLKAGFTAEFADREDGYKGMQKLYGLNLPNVSKMEASVRYSAIKSGQLNLIDVYSTDSEIEEYRLKVLEDDKGLFPPYQGAPLLRNETLEEFPELKDILNQLSGKITDDEMRKMNYAVNSENRSAEEVAREYLEQQGLLNK